MIKKLGGFEVVWSEAEKKKKRQFDEKGDADIFASSLTPPGAVSKIETAYEVRYDTYDAAGKRKQHRKKFAKLKGDNGAEAFEAKQTLSGVDESNITVKEYLDKFLLHVKQRRKLSTYAGYKYKLEHFFLTRFDGRMKLAKVKKSHIQAAIDKMIADGLSASTVASVRRVLNVAFRRALDEYIKENPVSRTEGGGKDAKVQNVLDAKQIELFLSKLIGTDFYMPAFLAASIGLSMAECAGLMWKYVDLTVGTLKIENIRQYVHEYGMLDGLPKTKKRRREILLPRFILAELQAERKRQLQNQLLLGDKYFKSEYVCRRVDGSELGPTVYGDYLAAGLQKAKLPHVSFHGLRHSCASVLIANGVPITVISEILGHANTQITMTVYAHALQSGKQEVADALDKIYGKK